MKAEYINPFVKSATNVLTTMAQITPKVGAPELKRDQRTRGVVTGLIGMAGEQVSGNMVLSFDKECVLGICTKMLMEEFDQLNDDVVDAVGELTNMISGGAKKLLNELGLFFEMATPVIIVGEHAEIKQLSAAPVISIPFTTEVGAFWIEANLATERKK